MKQLVLLMAVMASLCALATAAPLCVAGGTMTSYMALGSSGCEIGDKLFFNFNYAGTAGGAGVAVPSSAVTVTPVNTDPYNPGLSFASSGWSLSGTRFALVDSTIMFSVKTLSGLALIDDTTMTLGQYSTTGTGLANIAETVNPYGIELEVDAPSGPFTAHVTFDPISQVNVTKDLLVILPPTGVNSKASIASFTETFSQTKTPEPYTFGLIGFGLVGVGLLSRRKYKR